MAILAFDCCLRAVSVAVLDQEVVTQRTTETPDGGQAERLMPMIEETMAAAGIGFAQLEKIAVTLGPGGFTSVRVGLAAARGLALALGIPAVGQSSLAAIAASAVATELPAGATRLVATIPAGKGGVYWQSFDCTGEALDEAIVLEADALATAAISTGDVLAGPAADDVLRLRAPGHPGPLASLSAIAPRAALLTRAAKHLTQTSELRPIYLRPADARPQVGKALARVGERT